MRNVRGIRALHGSSIGELHGGSIGALHDSIGALHGGRIAALHNGSIGALHGGSITALGRSREAGKPVQSQDTISTRPAPPHNYPETRRSIVASPQRRNSKEKIWRFKAEPAVTEQARNGSRKPRSHYPSGSLVATPLHHNAI